jgi:hypothetical protein
VRDTTSGFTKVSIVVRLSGGGIRRASAGGPMTSAALFASRSRKRQPSG